MGYDYTVKQALLIIQGLSKTFGKKVILRDIGTDEHPFAVYDISRPNMEQGQVVAVVGRSGSGKTTLFRMIAGIHSPSTGIVQIPNPSDPTAYREVRGGDVGYVQQTYPLSRNQSVYSMLEDAAKQGKIPLKDQRPIIESYLEEWELKDQRYQSKNQLSGGQRQRVAIIEQILCSHHLMVFDEPFSGLDVKNIDDVKKSFNKISEASEINTILFSTHDIRLAVELSDLIYVIGYEKDKNKKIIPGGTVLKTYDLKKLGIAWTPYGSGHNDISLEITDLIKNE
jgi:ABC-type multidrug transport system ATPase subunit